MRLDRRIQIAFFVISILKECEADTSRNSDKIRERLDGGVTVTYFQNRSDMHDDQQRMIFNYGQKGNTE